MAFWNRRVPDRWPAGVYQPTFDGVTAAAQRIDVDNPADRKKLAKMQQQWQSDAWLYVNRVGELKDALRFVENAFRRLSIYAAFERHQGEEPIPAASATEQPDGDADSLPADELLSPEVAELAEGIVADFAARDGGQSSLMARLGVNIFVVGEAIVIQRGVPERRPVDGETLADVPMVWDWEVRSLHEMRDGRSGRTAVTVDTPDQQDGTPIVGLDGVPPYVERCWRRDSQWSAWADSNVRAAIDTLEEIRLLGLLARASLRSRAMAGFFRLPQELDFGDTDTPGGAPGPATQGVTFGRAMTEAFAAAISNEADPNTVSPILVSGKADFLRSDVFGPVEMPRRYAADERAQYEDAIKKLARTIELPQEWLTGLGDTSHWNAWQIDDSTYRAYIEPLAKVVAECLTYGLLRPRLLDAGVDPAVVARMFVAVDASRLVRRADVGKVAESLHEKGALSDEALRRSNEFGDEDAPSDEELLRRWLLKAAPSPDLMPLLMQLGALTDEQVQLPPALLPGSPPADDGTPETPVTEPDKGPPPQPDAVAAAASPAQVTASGLSTIDAVLFERVHSMCDQHVARLLERVGARVRSRQASSMPAAVKAAVAAAKGVTNAGLAAHLGLPAVTAALGADPVTEDDFAELHDRYDRSVAAAQEATVRELQALVGARMSDHALRAMRDKQTEDRKDGWKALLALLLAYTVGQIAAGEVDVEEGGEWDPSTVVRPSVIREALGIAGGSMVERTSRGGVRDATGGPLGGVATGATARTGFGQAGAPFTGWEWEYGSAPRVQPFEEHLALDGAPDTEWDGWEPGDHASCLCSSVAILAMPADQALVA